ncbi:DUF6531 domain-containing protein [Shewanella surugensis]|uniref:DUF6531 domain-containing protein n=1 Tax=Shewanella surugensis TaxID=212020 RepID=A0ABT0L6H4_9GAMM|nr:DUF6531 domain-containing protein [Shewanella surugensis]MCL1122967.1 DUF6531 domain-containing protein [Shewanella surugensis]
MLNKIKNNDDGFFEKMIRITTCLGFSLAEGSFFAKGFLLAKGLLSTRGLSSQISMPLKSRDGTHKGINWRLSWPQTSLKHIDILAKRYTPSFRLPTDSISRLFLRQANLDNGRAASLAVENKQGDYYFENSAFHQEDQVQAALSHDILFDEHLVTPCFNRRHVTFPPRAVIDFYRSSDPESRIQSYSTASYHQDLCRLDNSNSAAKALEQVKMSRLNPCPIPDNGKPEAGVANPSMLTADTFEAFSFHQGLQVNKQACEYVDNRTGHVIAWQQEFSLAGFIPLVFTRFYSSGAILPQLASQHLTSGVDKPEGLLGRTWWCSWDVCLLMESGQIRFIDETGTEACYVFPIEGQEVRSLTLPAWRLRREQGRYHMRHVSGLTYGFHVSGFHMGASNRLLLSEIADNNGNSIHFIYQQGLLTWVLLSDDRYIQVSMQEGCIKQLVLTDEGKKPLKTLVSFSYNTSLQLVEANAPATHQVYYEYDKRDCLLKTADTSEPSVDSEPLISSRQSWVQYTYDDKARALSRLGADGLGHAQFSYDDDNLIIYHKTSHKGIVCYHRNQQGQMVKWIDAKGGITSFEWQANQLTSQINPLGERTRWHYDAWGQVCDVLHHDNSRYCYTFNDNGKLLSAMDAAGSTWQYTYNKKGNCIQTLLPSQKAIFYQYSRRGQLAWVIHQDGSQIGFHYQVNGQLSEIHLPQDMTQLQFEYDEFGRLMSQQWQVDKVSVKAQYWSYKGQSLNPETWTRFDYSQCHFQYNHAGNLIKSSGFSAPNMLNRQSGKANSPPNQRKQFASGIQRFTYGAFACLRKHDSSETALKQAPKVQYGYHGQGQLLGMKSDSSHWCYRFNTSGEISALMYGDGRKVQFEYDALGRLSQRTALDGTQLRFYYDVLGRLIQKQALKPSKPLSSRTNISSISYTVMNNTFFDYDASSQLIKVRTDDNRSQKMCVEYQLDADGGVVKERINECIGGEYLSPLFFKQMGCENKELIDYFSTATVAQNTGLITQTLRAQESQSTRFFERDPITLQQTLLNAMDSLHENKSSLQREEAFLSEPLVTDEISLALVDKRYANSVQVIANSAYRFDVAGRVREKVVNHIDLSPKQTQYFWDEEDKLLAVLLPTGDSWRCHYDGLARLIDLEYVQSR